LQRFLWRLVPLAAVGCGSASTSGAQQADAGSGMSACQPTPAVTCPAGVNGYTCPVGDDPENYSSTLLCSQTPPTGISGNFCCSDLGMKMGPSYCNTGSPGSCPVGAQAYACIGGAIPADSTLTCSTPTAGAASGEEDYCCTSGSCTATAQVPCSPSALSGYVCTGAAVPDQSATNCEQVGPNDYCCIPGPCQIDSLLTCTAGSYGFDCPTGDTPQKYVPGLMCSMPVSSGGMASFCCQ
jgi:hypothetical protein